MPVLELKPRTATASKKRLFSIAKFYNQNNRHGNFAVIKGKIRTGKTYLACILLRHLIRAGFIIFTNIKLKNMEMDSLTGLWVLRDAKTREITVYYITSDRDWFTAYINTEGLDSITVFDDAQASKMSSLDATSQSGKTINSLMLLIGKFQSNCLFIMHEKYCPHFVLEFSRLWLYKLTQYGFYFSKQRNLGWGEIAKNKDCHWTKQRGDPLEYDTYGIPQFNLEMDLEAMYIFLSKWHGSLRDGVRAFMEREHEREEDRMLKRLTWRQIIRAVLFKREKQGITEGRQLVGMKGREIFERNTLYDTDINR